MLLWLMAALIVVLGILLFIFKKENQQLKKQCMALSHALKEKQTPTPQYTQIAAMLKEGKSTETIMQELGVAQSIVTLVEKMESYREDLSPAS